VVPIIFGSLSAAAGMAPVFWVDALMLAYGGMLMRADADNRKAAPPEPAQTERRDGGLK
jgi:hypothetical protein